MRWKPTPVFIVVALLSLVCSACQSTHQPGAPSQITTASVAASTGDPLSATAVGRRRSENKQAAMALQVRCLHNYEGQWFTVNMNEMRDDASAALIANNPSLNEIYASNDLD
jgi:Flp pilus assembly protein TadD